VATEYEDHEVLEMARQLARAAVVEADKSPSLMGMLETEAGALHAQRLEFVRRADRLQRRLDALKRRLNGHLPEDTSYASVIFKSRVKNGKRIYGGPWGCKWHDSLEGLLDELAHKGGVT